jgi:hypothetical protein
MENLLIDPEAKTKVSLIKVLDAGGNPYFIGKLQFPGTMDFEKGVSFMVFTAEDGYEELQIAPVDPSRRSKANRDNNGAMLNNGKFSIDLIPMIDNHGSKYYVGEVTGLSKMELREGIFFTVFTSISGQEQIQISRLQVKVRPKYDLQRSNIFDPKRFNDSDI